MRRLVLLALLLLAGSAQAAPILLGDDPADDDSEVLYEPVGAGVPAPDTTDIDDIRELYVETVGDEVQFRVVVSETPSDATLIYGQYCWLAGFQVNDDSTEHVAMGCQMYEADGSVQWVSASTSRGGNVASSAEWIEAENTVLIHVPLADIHAAPGDILMDLYALTYSGNGLYVTDPAPDAKSDRNAATNFGCYVIGLGADDDWSSCTPVAIGDGFQAALAGVTLDEAGTYGNGTATAAFNLTAAAATSITLSPDVTSVPGAAAEPATVDLEAGAAMIYELNITLDGVAPGNHSVPVAISDGEDTVQAFVNFTVLASGEEPVAPSEPGNPNPQEPSTSEPEGTGDPETEPAPEAEPEGEDSPGLGILATLALIGAACYVRRK